MSELIVAAGLAQNRVQQGQRLAEAIIHNSINSQCRFFAGLNLNNSRLRTYVFILWFVNYQSKYGIFTISALIHNQCLGLLLDSLSLKTTFICRFKDNVAVYKDLSLVTVTIKNISHVSTVKGCNYRSVALASIRSFAVGRAVLTNVYWFSILAGSVSTDQQEKKDKRQTGPWAGRIMTQRRPT